MLLLKANETKRHKPQISHRHENRWHWSVVVSFFYFALIFFIFGDRKREEKTTRQLYSCLRTFILFLLLLSRSLPFDARCDRSIDFSSCFNSCFISLIVCRWAIFFSFIPASLPFLVLMLLLLLLSPVSRLISFYCCCRFFSLFLHLHFVLPQSRIKLRQREREKKWLFNQKKQKWSEKNSTN